MTRRTTVGAIAGVLVVGATLAWFVSRHGAAGSLRPGRATLAIEWRGRFHGRMTLPAHVNWCPVTRVAVVEAVSGDSGVAVVVYEPNALAGGALQVYSPEVAAAAQRPSATAAMRWMRLDRDTALAGFRALSGTARIDLGPGRLSGEINAKMRGVTGSDTLVVRGIFRDVPIVSSAVGCT